MDKCKECNKKFKKRRPNQVYCTPACIKNMQRNKYFEKANLKNKWKIESDCILCNNKYVKKSTNQTYCSVDCRNKSLNSEYLLENKDKFDFLLSKRISYLRIRIKIFDRDKFSCKYCGRNPREHEGVILHLDHKIPKIKGGSNSEDNLITSCGECNLGKSDIILDLWKKDRKK